MKAHDRSNGEGPSGSVSDVEAMRRVRDGEVDGLEVIFERHSAKLYAYCLRRLGDPAAAEDVVQDVFVRVLKYRESFRDGGSVLPWLFTTARNACWDHLRKRGREEPTDEIREVSPGPLPLREAEKREELLLLERALGRLPDDTRDLILLAKFGDMRYDDLAPMVGCTVGALKVRVHRALKRLRRELDALSGEVNRS